MDLKSNAALMLELADSPAKPGLIGELNKRIVADPQSLYAAGFRLYRRLVEAEKRFTEAREAFLNLIAEARDVREDIDADTDSQGRIRGHHRHIVTVEESDLAEFIDALGIPRRYDQCSMDAVLKTLEQESKS